MPDFSPGITAMFEEAGLQSKYDAVILGQAKISFSSLR